LCDVNSLLVGTTDDSLVALRIVRSNLRILSRRVTTQPRDSKVTFTMLCVAVHFGDQISKHLQQTKVKIECLPESHRADIAAAPSSAASVAGLTVLPKYKCHQRRRSFSAIPENSLPLLPTHRCATIGDDGTFSTLKLTLHLLQKALEAAKELMEGPIKDRSFSGRQPRMPDFRPLAGYCSVCRSLTKYRY
jgi:hypothetical protein